MKFSTISRNGNAFEVFYGATFDLRIPSESKTAPYITTQSLTYRGQTHHTVRLAGTVAISNELLLSPDALVHAEGGGLSVTILKAAARIGNKTVLVSESAAQKCESQHHAHAVWFPSYWIPMDGHLYGTPTSNLGQVPKLSVGNDSMSPGQILMPGLAILTDKDVLNVEMVRYGAGETFFNTKAPPIEESIASFQVSFDGTNIKFNGITIEPMSQECFV
jgi:hypothetical protein